MRKIMLGIFSFLIGSAIISCGSDEVVKKDANSAAERKQFIQASEKQAAEGIAKLDADVKEAMQWNLKQVKTSTSKNKDTADEANLKLELVKKIRPAQTLLQDAQYMFASAKKSREGFESRLDESSLPVFDEYKTNMKTVLEKISKGTENLKTAMDEFKKQFKNLK